MDTNLVNKYGLDPELALYGTELCELKRNKENILGNFPHIKHRKHLPRSLPVG